MTLTRHPPSMRFRPFVAAAFAAAAACRSVTAPAPTAQVSLDSLLPAGPPYITGTVVERGRRLGDAPSVLVATDPRDPLTGRSAHVVLGGDATVVHRDGRRAAVGDLRPGRVVTAWVGPTELRSLPPVVFGRVLVIEP